MRKNTVPHSFCFPMVSWWIVERLESVNELPRAAVGPQSRRPVVGSLVIHWTVKESSVSENTVMDVEVAPAQSTLADASEIAGEPVPSFWSW